MITQLPMGVVMRTDAPPIPAERRQRSALAGMRFWALTTWAGAALMVAMLCTGNTDAVALAGIIVCFVRLAAIECRVDLGEANLQRLTEELDRRANP